MTSEYDSDVDGEPDGRRKILTRRSLVLSAVILFVAALGFAMSFARGRTDSALLFVGLPTLLALGIALRRPARGIHGITFKALTICLLLAAVLLHEGAICVLFAAPLVYAVGHFIAFVSDVANKGHRGAYAIVPLALLLGMEGLAPGWRIAPTQTVTVTHLVAIGPAEVALRLAAGPNLANTARPLLLTSIPVPEHNAGLGLAVGNQWIFHFHGSSHGPGGELVTEVVRREAGSGGGMVEFRRVGDTSVIARWLDWQGATVRWHSVAGGTEVRLTVTFTRGLDPSWYFGPIEDVMVRAGAGFLLDALSLPDESLPDESLPAEPRARR